MKKIILVLISVGIGSFAMTILENININVWISRGIGAFISVVISLFLYELWIKKS